MPAHRRPRIPGATLFVTVCLADREDDLLLREIGRLREAVRATRAERPFAIEAWVTLPDHFHAVLRLPEGDSDHATRIGAIRGRFSHGLRRSGRTGPWQARYREHHVRDAADLEAHLSYCWNDPVKHRLVADPFDWRHSSIHRDMAVRLARGARLRAAAG